MATTYCTTPEVIGEFKSLNTTSTGVAITDAKIDGFRDDAFAYINAKIGNKYATPIPADAGCFAIVRMIELYIVKARIQSIIPVRTAADGAKQNEKPEDLAKKADDLLEVIVSGKIKMAGATLASTSDGVSSFNVDQGTPHIVKKARWQW